MKHQYFGDVNDYVKYGLLRCFVEAGFRLGVCWMLTPSDSSRDGRKIQYLKQRHEWRHHDVPLFDHLKRKVLDEGVKHLSHIEGSGLLERVPFVGDVVPASKTERLRWHSSVLSKFESANLVFYDPDNGIEVESTPLGRKNSSKFVYWTELADVWRMGPSVLVYQHFRREPRTEFIASIIARMKATLPESRVAALRTAHVLFLLAYHRHQAEVADAALARVEARWRPRVAVVRDESETATRSEAG